MSSFRSEGKNLLQTLLGVGPTRVEEWTEYAQQVGGTYVPGTSTRSDRVVIPNARGRIVIDLFSRQAHPVTTFTRIRIAYHTTRFLAFSIRHTDVPDALAKVFGRGRDIEIGDALFDGNYVVRASDAEAVRALLAPEELRKRFPHHTGFTVETSQPSEWLPTLPPRRSAIPAGVFVLSCWVNGVVRDFAALTRHVELVDVVMARLREIDHASEEIPSVDPE